MYYVISQSTDLRSPNTVVKNFTSIIAAKKYAKLGNGEYTYSDPEAARNWHHTFKEVYHLKGRINKKDPIFNDRGTTCYPRCYADNLAYYIEKYGEKIDD